jgi:Flp pilus assembly pilin Flp
MNGAVLLERFICDESGQGITEYGAILAFVALLIVLLFGFTTGALASSLQNAYSTIVSTMNTLNSAVS